MLREIYSEPKIQGFFASLRMTVRNDIFRIKTTSEPSANEAYHAASPVGSASRQWRI